MRPMLILAAAAAATLLGGTADARRHGYGHHFHHARSSHHRSHHHRSYRPRAFHVGTGYYRARSGHYVHRPMHADSRPDGATARCRDGSWSFSESRRGTCSWHGGVASWVR